MVVEPETHTLTHWLLREEEEPSQWLIPSHLTENWRLFKSVLKLDALVSSTCLLLFLISNSFLSTVPFFYRSNPCPFAGPSHSNIWGRCLRLVRLEQASLKHTQNRTTLASRISPRDRSSSNWRATSIQSSNGGRYAPHCQSDLPHRREGSTWNFWFGSKAITLLFWSLLHPVSIVIEWRSSLRFTMTHSSASVVNVEPTRCLPSLSDRTTWTSFGGVWHWITERYGVKEWHCVTWIWQRFAEYRGFRTAENRTATLSAESTFLKLARTQEE